MVQGFFFTMYAHSLILCFDVQANTTASLRVIDAAQIRNYFSTFVMKIQITS
jgi:hypothetical protein